MIKTLNQVFFFPPPKSEYFFSNIENQNMFLEKTLILHNRKRTVRGGGEKLEQVFLFCFADYRRYNLYFIVCSNLAMSERLLS